MNSIIIKILVPLLLSSQVIIPLQALPNLILRTLFPRLFRPTDVFRAVFCSVHLMLPDSWSYTPSNAAPTVLLAYRNVWHNAAPTVLLAYRNVWHNAAPTVLLA